MMNHQQVEHLILLSHLYQIYTVFMYETMQYLVITMLMFYLYEVEVEVVEFLQLQLIMLHDGLDDDEVVEE